MSLDVLFNLIRKYSSSVSGTVVCGLQLATRQSSGFWCYTADTLKWSSVKGVPQKTLETIYKQELQNSVRRLYHQRVVNNIEAHYEKYIQMVENGNPPGVLLNIAQSIPFSPAMLAKSVLEHHLLLKAKLEGETDAVKPTIDGQAKKLLKNTAKIQDKILAYEVNLCLHADTVYGPHSNTISHSLGHEYECILQCELKAANIPYFNEDDLRDKGYDKTPDIKLKIPIAVNGHVVSWIESKALFGEPINHRQYLKSQLWSYWNRFGPGLVIYWLGFVNEIDDLSTKGIQIMDRFPKREEITYLVP